MDSNAHDAQAQPERYQIVLEAGSDDYGRPAVVRLRCLLKHARRALGLRCVTCSPPVDGGGK